jgi:hypothetical protein
MLEVSEMGAVDFLERKSFFQLDAKNTPCLKLLQIVGIEKYFPRFSTKSKFHVSGGTITTLISYLWDTSCENGALVVAGAT